MWYKFNNYIIMKNGTLMKFLKCLHIRDYSHTVDENGLKMDFSRVNYSQNVKSIEKKSSIPSYLILVLLFLFTNFLVLIILFYYYLFYFVVSL